MKIYIETDYMWDEISDTARECLIIELIETAPDAQEFRDKIIKKLNKLNID